MSKNSIKIDGSKLREALERNTKSTIYEIALNNGFSRNLIAEATRKGIASPIIQMIAEKCGVYTEEYILKDPEPTLDPTPELKGQITIDDLESIKRSELSELIRQVIREELVSCFNSLVCSYDIERKLSVFKLDKEVK